jgi:hypothetical protein
MSDNTPPEYRATRHIFYWLTLGIIGFEMSILWTGMALLTMESALHGPTTNLLADVSRGDIHPVSMFVAILAFLLGTAGQAYLAWKEI